MSRVAGDRATLYDSRRSEAAQRAAFLNGDVPVAVYGLGKMGLPLAAVYADVTGNTTGVDIDPTVVETVAAGDCHVSREPGLADLVADVSGSGALDATTDARAAAADAAIHVLMVPTLLTEADEPDLSALQAAVEAIAAGLDPGDTVIVESTVPPRTARDCVVPTLADGSGLDPTEFGVAACPERTVSGQAIADIRGTHPKVVGGVDEESTRVAALVYGEITDNEVVEASEAAVAEAVKVFEGVYRDVNIALANQLALYADPLDLDVREAIDVANTLSVCDIHDPGPGVGGHCIPVYPHFLASRPEIDASLLEVARSLNEGMPSYTVDLLEDALAERGVGIADATVALLGVTYKDDIAELRNAPAIPIARELRWSGADVLAVDPLVEDWDAVGDVDPVPLDDLPGRDLDAVLVVTAHAEFRAFDWDALDPTVVVDGRDALALDDTAHTVYTIGGRPP